MFLHFLLFGALFTPTRGYFSEERSPEESRVQPPTLVIAILARNSAHSLPYYLGALERLNYPKDRISVWWVFLGGPAALCTRSFTGPGGHLSGGRQADPPPLIKSFYLFFQPLFSH